MRLDLGVDALVGAADQRIALLDFRIDAPVATGPIGMFAKQAYASGDEEFHCTLLPLGIVARIIIIQLVRFFTPIESSYITRAWNYTSPSPVAWEAGL